MINPQFFIDQLRQVGIDFFTGVPDSLMKQMCAYLQHNIPKRHHIITANEGGAIALSVGYHLATRKSAMAYMQNSGIGNALNPLVSLADRKVYSIPLLLIIGWRGEPGRPDEPQHVKQGEITLSLFETLGIPYSVLEANESAVRFALTDATDYMYTQSAPFALIIKKNFFEQYEPASSVDDLQPSSKICREEAISEIIANLATDDIVVATTGMASRELFEIREKNRHPHDKDFLTVGGMGHASQIALGIAMQKPSKRVYCIDGDGALIMHMGALSINGTVSCPNFFHIVINNGAHGSVGGQPTAARNIDLTQLALANGYRQVYQAETLPDISQALQAIKGKPGPAFIEIKVRLGHRKDLGRPTISPLKNKSVFMESF